MTHADADPDAAALWREYARTRDGTVFGAFLDRAAESGDPYAAACSTLLAAARSLPPCERPRDPYPSTILRGSCSRYGALCGPCHRYVSLAYEVDDFRNVFDCVWGDRVRRLTEDPP